MRRHWIRFTGLLALCGTLWGCGYALVGRGSNIPDDIRSVYLAAFENLTQRLEVEQFFTQSIADELVTRRRFELVRSEGEADAVLAGAVSQFRVTPISFNSEGRAQEYEITIIARVSFRRPGDKDPVWEADNYLFRESYEIDPSETEFFDQENLAIEQASERFAETMVSDLLEGF